MVNGIKPVNKLIVNIFHFFFPLSPLFPALVSFLVVSLMTPTATVCFMSLTANLPRGP